MILSNDLIKSKLRWLQACIMLGALLVLPLGLTNAQQDPVTVEPAVSDELSYNSQLQEMDKNIADLKARIDETNAVLKEYQSKVEETPKRDQELVILNRNYANLKETHDSLLRKKLETENQTKQLQGPSSSLSDELKTAEQRLNEKEHEIKGYRERYMGSLPEQLDTNLSLLEKFSKNLLQLNSKLRDAENKRAAILNDMPASN